MIQASEVSCLVCGGAAWMRLPDPGPRSVRSDGQLLPEPLAKFACQRCGLVARRLTDAPPNPSYADGYTLYAHAPSVPFERERQADYAAWIASAVTTTPESVLDVGCGNGSLLLALRATWPNARLLGCDPSAASVAQGLDAGLHLWQATSDSLPPGIAGLVVAINVIEHCADPVAFLADLGRAAGSQGRVVVICPDGERPGTELLFADHLYSFTLAHLQALCGRAGLAVQASGAAPAAIGAFQMIAAAPATSPNTISITSPSAILNERRAAFLRCWADLDEQLVSRMPDQVVCFGVGETANLLAAFAPVAWSRVTACTADAFGATRVASLPVVPLDAVPRESHILLAVRGVDQPRVAGRLRERFASVTTWYDLAQE